MAIGTNKFVHTESHIGSKFSKMFLEVVYRRKCSCALTSYIAGFLCGFRWHHVGQIQNRIFGQFCTSLRKYSVRVLSGKKPAWDDAFGF